MRLRTSLWALVVLLAGASMFAQGPRRDAGAGLPPPPEPPKDALKGKPIAIDVDLVNMDVVVADKNGTLIKGIEKRDFKVFDDGVEQTISSFSSSESPLTVVIMFDNPCESSRLFHCPHETRVSPPASLKCAQLGRGATPPSLLRYLR